VLLQFLLIAGASIQTHTDTPRTPTKTIPITNQNTHSLSLGTH